MKKQLLPIAGFLLILILAAFTHGIVVFNGIINVTSYGAVCDGVTDDTTAIRNAVTAAGGSNISGPFTSTAILLIPGPCLVTSTITIRNATGQNFPFVVQCTGGGAGLIWGGSDNAGPLLTLGDATFSHSDGPFALNYCHFNGSSSGHKPSIAIYLAMTNNSSIVEGAIGSSNANVYVGVKCGDTCLLTKIDHLMISCQTNCVDMAINNGSMFANNNFYQCGGWCYFGRSDAAITFLNNYFEGNTSGASGSVSSTGDGVRFIANAFEDQSTAAGAAFLSISLGSGNAFEFNGNYYVGGCGGGAGCPNYFISLGSTGAIQAEFHGEMLGGGVGASGFIINAQQSQTSTWVGGLNCDGTKIFGGSQAAHQQMVAACGSTYNSGTSNSQKLQMLALPTSCSGLATGTLWNNSSVVNVCP